jgi:SAM-dependent methyltransferase
MASQDSIHSFDYSQILGIPEVAVRIRLLHSRMQELRSSGGILEVGLGAGDVTLMLSRAFVMTGRYKLTCVDADADNIGLVRRRLDAEHLPLPDFIYSKIETANLGGPYSHLVLLGILEHLEYPVTVLERLRSVLAPEGHAHIVVNLANSLHRLLGVEMGQIPAVEALAPSDYSLGHHRVYTLGELRSHVTKAGLIITQEIPFYLKPLPTSMLSPLPMELHMGLHRLGMRFPEFASYAYVECC